MHRCPTCNDSFETRRGLGVHHSSVHNERLPNRACECCGSEFYADYQKKYCSDDCRSESVSFEGSSNPNYRGGKTETECELCDTAFEYYPSDKQGLYCEDCVEKADWRDLPAIDGENNPHWNGGTRAVDCEICGDSVERYPSEIGDVTLCGQECRAVWLSEEFTGEGHPNWRGGGNEAYGKGWAAVREAALKRDDYACVNCGATKDELQRNPDVHHIVPVRTFVESDEHEKTDAHRVENVASLCLPCHRKAEFGAIAREELRTAIDASSAPRRLEPNC